MRVDITFWTLNILMQGCVFGTISGKKCTSFPFLVLFCIFHDKIRCYFVLS